MSDQNELLITEECYALVKQAYIKHGFLLWEFPCRRIPEVQIGGGYTTRPWSFRRMDVPVPPEIDHMWEYIP